MLLFAQSVLQSESSVTNSVNTDSADKSGQHVTFSPATALAFHDGRSSSSTIPPATSHIASLRAALLIVKAVTLLTIGDTHVDAAFNKSIVWEAAEHIIQPMHDDVEAPPHCTESCATQHRKQNICPVFWCKSYCKP